MNPCRPIAGAARPLLPVLALLAGLAGCSGAPTLKVRSLPPTAKIYVNGIPVGETEKTIVLPFDDGDRVWVQVVHPTGRLVGETIFTEDNLPEDEIFFDLR